jgi:hypothetical protein
MSNVAVKRLRGLPFEVAVADSGAPYAALMTKKVI